MKKNRRKAVLCFVYDGNRRCVGAGLYPARDVCFVLPTTGYFPFLDKRGKFRYLSPTGYFCQ